MKYCILMGSPRKEGNTISVLHPFMDGLTQAGHEVECIWLYDKEIKACTGCRACQDDFTGFGCVQKDDMHEIFDQILASDCLILATPIHSWYCTAPMKAALDRLVYGMNKYYGKQKGPVLWRKKKMALFVTCGYPQEESAALFEQGMIRYCRHSRLQYQGMVAIRDYGYHTVFLTDEKIAQARAFAAELNAKNADQ